MDARCRGREEAYELWLVFTTKGQGERLTRGLTSAEDLCACVFLLCLLVCLLCAHLNVWARRKTTIAASSAVAHLRATAEVAHKPADYLEAPQGLPSLLHKLPQLNTSYSLTLSFFPRFLSCCFAFIFASSNSHGTLAAITFFSHPPIHRFCVSRGFPSHCFPGIVPSWCFTPTLCVHRSYNALTAKKTDWIRQILVNIWENIHSGHQ